MWSIQIVISIRRVKKAMISLLRDAATGQCRLDQQDIIVIVWRGTEKRWGDSEEEFRIMLSVSLPSATIDMAQFESNAHRTIQCRPLISPHLLVGMTRGR